jgi:hypothetical protein
VLEIFFFLVRAVIRGVCFGKLHNNKGMRLNVLRSSRHTDAAVDDIITDVSHWDCLGNLLTLERGIHGRGSYVYAWFSLFS